MQHWLVLLLRSARDTGNVKYGDHFRESPRNTVDGTQFTDTESANFVQHLGTCRALGPWSGFSEGEGNVRSEHNPEAVLFDASVAICSISSVQLVTGLSSQ